jgi:hypothetical protein
MSPSGVVCDTVNRSGAQTERRDDVWPENAGDKAWPTDSELASFERWFFTGKDRLCGN